MRVRERLRTNPAESASLGAGIVAVLSALGFHATDDQRAAIIFGVSTVAAIVTFVVNRYRNGKADGNGGG